MSSVLSFFKEAEIVFTTLDVRARRDVVVIVCNKNTLHRQTRRHPSINTFIAVNEQHFLTSHYITEEKKQKEKTTKRQKGRMTKWTTNTNKLRSKPLNHHSYHLRH